MALQSVPVELVLSSGITLKGQGNLDSKKQTVSLSYNLDADLSAVLSQDRKQKVTGGAALIDGKRCQMRLEKDVWKVFPTTVKDEPGKTVSGASEGQGLSLGSMKWMWDK